MDDRLDTAGMEARIIEVLHDCYDPEIPVDVFELGLIYEVRVSTQGKARVTMTLTSPACPVAESLPGEIERAIRAQVQGLTDVEVEVVWDPPWNVDMMSDAAKLELGMM